MNGCYTDECARGAKRVSARVRGSPPRKHHTNRASSMLSPVLLCMNMQGLRNLGLAEAQLTAQQGHATSHSRLCDPCSVVVLLSSLA